ncbi:MAG: stage III sporulation protein AA [Bacillota bacterium]|jgi:stage III sporulation protein AA
MSDKAVCFGKPGLPGGWPWPEVLKIIPASLRQLLGGLPAPMLSQLEEIRLRQNRPLILAFAGGDRFLDSRGGLVGSPNAAYLVSADDINRTLQLISNSSIYAVEEDLRNGYITLPGGHRVGVTGKVVLDGGRVRSLKYISGFNVRISRDIKGIAQKVIPFIWDRRNGRTYHTLIFSPPRCGKTTLLRDVIRQLSNGVAELGIPGMNVGVVDERSEIAGCFRGVPSLDIGLRADVLDGCPKAEGMMMLLRAMSPAVLATDEIGRPEDVAALEEVFSAGVSVLTTVHGSSPGELASRPGLQGLFRLRIIERLVLLGRSAGPGTLEKIFNGKTLQPLEVR